MYDAVKSFSRFMLMAILAVVAMLTLVPSTALAESPDVSLQEQLDIIRAKYYLEQTDPNVEKSPTVASVEALLNDKLFSDEILFGNDEDTISKGLAENEGFQNAVTAWKATHYFTGSGNPAEDALDMQGYYEAIIFAVLKAEASKDFEAAVDGSIGLSEGTAGDLSSYAKKGVDLFGKQNKVNKAVATALKDVDLLSHDYTSLTDEQRKTLDNVIKSNLFESHPNLDTWTWGSGGIAKFLSSGETVYEGVCNLTSYVNLVEATEGQRVLVQRMYAACPQDTEENVTLKAALGEVCTSMQGVEEAFKTGTVDVLEDLAADTEWELMQMALDTAIEASPHV